MFVQVTAKNVGGVFFETQCSVSGITDACVYNCIRIRLKLQLLVLSSFAA